MKIKRVVAIIMLVSMVMTACAPSKLLVHTPTSTQTSSLVPTSTSTLTKTSTPTITPTSTPTLTPTQVGGGHGKFVFSLKRNDFIASFPALQGEYNVFSTNLDGTNLTPITDGLLGYNFVTGFSPDGQQILVSSIPNIWSRWTYGDLYVMNLDGSESLKLTNRYFSMDMSAFWLSDGSKIVYIAYVGTGNAIFVVNPDGSNPIQITKPNSLPSELYPTADDNAVYWSGACDAQRLNCAFSWRKTSIDGSDEKDIWKNIVWDTNSSPSKLSDFIWYYPGPEYSDVNISDLSMDHSISIGPSNCSPCVFLSPDGRKLILGNIEGSTDKFTFKIWFFKDPLSSDVSVVDLSAYFDVTGSFGWSPDSRLLLLRVGRGQAWYGILKIVDVEKMQILQTLPEVMAHAYPLKWLP